MVPIKNRPVHRRISPDKIRKLASQIAAKHKPDKIVLFGSMANKNAGPDSDVDLLVIMNSEIPSWKKAVEISCSIKHNFPIDIVVKTPSEIARRIRMGDCFFKDIAQNGKTLYEFDR